MCGRYTQRRPIKQYMARLSPAWEQPLQEDRAPTWNLAPTALSWVVRDEQNHLAPSLLRWGFGGTDGEKGLAPINARVETASEKFLFKDAWLNRRCLIPADGWYEWKADATGKQPYYFTRKDGNALFFAGIWTANTFALFTTDADGELTTIHDRKPLSLDTADALSWIRESSPTNNIMGLAVPADAFTFYPVSKAVSNWRNEGEQLAERVVLTQQPIQQQATLF